MDEVSVLVAGVLGIPRGEITEATGPGSIPQWDSLAHIHLVVAIEETYGVQLSTEEIVGLRSVGHIAALLDEKGVRLG